MVIIIRLSGDSPKPDRPGLSWARIKRHCIRIANGVAVGLIVWGMKALAVFAYARFMG